MSNILQAISNIEQSSSYTALSDSLGSANRMNSMGEGLEVYIKAAFSNSLTKNDANLRDERIENTFSYLGNANNIPDAVLQGGDAIEVKKIQSFHASIALNSSYPKDKLYADDHRVSQACRSCETWVQKDIIYAIGIVPKHGDLQHLWLVYGDCYAAARETYTRIGTTIKTGVEQIDGVHFAETKELGRVNAVDPLGITYLRIRGMWHIENPIHVFKDVYEVNPNLTFSLSCLMKKEKFESFSEVDKSSITSNENIELNNIKIKDPNNPAKRLDAVLITISKP